MDFELNCPNCHYTWIEAMPKSGQGVQCPQYFRVHVPIPREPEPAGPQSTKADSPGARAGRVPPLPVPEVPGFFTVKACYLSVAALILDHFSPGYLKSWEGNLITFGAMFYLVLIRYFLDRYAVPLRPLLLPLESKYLQN